MSLKDKFPKYRVNSAFTEGVEIQLDHYPGVVAVVRLPGQHNRPYQQAIFGSMEIDANGVVGMTSSSALDAKNRLVDAFIAHCIVSIAGEEPDESLRDELLPMTEELMEKATEIAANLDTVVDDASKKSLPTSIGNVGGAAA